MTLPSSWGFCWPPAPASALASGPSGEGAGLRQPPLSPAAASEGGLLCPARGSAAPVWTSSQERPRPAHSGAALTARWPLPPALPRAPPAASTAPLSRRPRRPRRGGEGRGGPAPPPLLLKSGPGLPSLRRGDAAFSAPRLTSARRVSLGKGAADWLEAGREAPSPRLTLLREQPKETFSAAELPFFDAVESDWSFCRSIIFPDDSENCHAPLQLAFPPPIRPAPDFCI